MPEKRKAKKAKKALAKSRPANARRAAAPKASAGSRGLRLGEVSPSFTVNDLDRSLAWYRDVLGFTVEERWEQDGQLRGVSLRAGGASFMLGQDDWKKGRDRRKGEGFRVYCETAEDVDALAERIKARGGRLDSEPADESWGWRDFSLTDPDGFKLTIGAEIRKR
jgi:uncharacterized glyoxalase superfamily protein PhnB